VTASGAALAACAPQVIERTVEVEVPVEQTVLVEVEKEVEVPVEQTVVVEVPVDQVNLRFTGWVRQYGVVEHSADFEVNPDITVTPSWATGRQPAEVVRRDCGGRPPTWDGVVAPAHCGGKVLI
jgi:hypothetical protein